MVCWNHLWRLEWLFLVPCPLTDSLRSCIHCHYKEHIMIATIFTTILPSLTDLQPQINLSSITYLAGTFIESAAPPIGAENMVKEIATWLTKILSSVAFLFLIIDLFKHVTT